MLLTSTDGGGSWTARDMSSQAGMLLDVKFVDARTGFLCAGSDSEVEQSHALILKTRDGGASWTRVEMGKATNKIRLLKNADGAAGGAVGYAIGVDVYKLTVGAR